MDKKEVEKLLKEIGLSEAEAFVYVALLDGAQSVKEIMKITDEKRPTVYYSLNSLEKRGLVSKTGKDYGNKFQLESLDKLTELVNKGIRKQNELLERANKLKGFYPENNNSNKVLVSYFDNYQAIKSAIFYTLYSRSKVIRTIVSGENFFNQMGKEFVKEYVEEKLKRKIKTKALWEDIPDKKIIEKYYLSSEIKQLPIGMHNSFETVIFIYDDKTLYIGPKKENYAVLVQSKAHSKMMVSIFENIWGQAIKVK